MPAQIAQRDEAARPELRAGLGRVELNGLRRADRRSLAALALRTCEARQSERQLPQQAYALPCVVRAITSVWEALRT